MATVTHASAGQATTGWTSSANVNSTTGDNVYATAAPGKNSTLNMFCYFANFSEIPAGSTINSVTARCEWFISASVTGSLFTIAINSGGTTGSAAATTVVTTNPTLRVGSANEGQDTVVASSGISLADLDGTNGQGFIQALIAYGKGNTNTASTASADFVSMTVDYTAPAGGGADSFSLIGGGYYPFREFRERVRRAWQGGWQKRPSGVLVPA